MGSPMYDPFHKGYRLYVGGLNPDLSRSDVEKEFGKYGTLNDVWVARNPPGFAFIIFKHADDADRAVRRMDNKKMSGERIKVEHARYPSNPRGSKCVSDLTELQNNSELIVSVQTTNRFGTISA